MALVKHNKLLNASESAIFRGLEVCGKPPSYPIITISVPCDARRQAVVSSCDRARERERERHVLSNVTGVLVSSYSSSQAFRCSCWHSNTVKCSSYFTSFTK